MRKFEGRGVKRSELFHTSRFTLQTSRSSGGRTRTFTRLLNREPPYHWATPDCYLIKSGWLDLNQRSRVSGTRGVPDPVFNEHGHILICKRPARIELAFSAWQADGLPLHHGRKMHHYQIVKDQNQEHRAGIEPASPRYDGGVLPLDHQCLCRFSGTGENRTHIVRFKRPMHYLVCHNPMCFCFVSIGAEGIEPSTLVL